MTDPDKHTTANTQNVGLGIGLMLLAAGMSTGLSASAKWLLSEIAMPVVQVVALRYLVHFLFTATVFLPRHGFEILRSRAPVQLLLRSVFLVLATVLNFLALKSLPLTLTTAIMFAIPIAITLLSVPILGERIGIHRIAAVLAGFAGVLVIVQPGSATFQPAVFLSVGAVIAASLYYVMTRKLAGVDRNASIQLWSSGLAALCFLPFSFLTWTWPETATGYVILVSMGLFGAFSHIASTEAHRLAEASLLAPFGYAQIITATIVGVLVFEEIPIPTTYIGCAIVVLSGIYIWWRERR
ncbi:DMT family transporter [Oricola sp.]|uniref:DMT family transporter n=1 Tax=Oricola sp. TaxID=1979950 RepID=UPI003BA87652